MVKIISGLGAGASVPIDDEILSAERTVDPYPYFAELREHDPIHWNERYRAWFVHRFDDVWEGLRDPRFSSDRILPVFETKLTDEQRDDRRPTFDILQHWLVFKDPPDHTRLRRLLNQAFTPRSVQAWRPRIEDVVDEMVSKVAKMEHFDLIRDFAYPIPAVIIAEMMGVPPGDRELFKSWSDDIMIIVFGGDRVAGRRRRAQQGLLDLAEYLHGLVRHFRREPADNLITSLVQAKESNDALSEDEIVATCTLLLFGGHETTTNLIGNGMRVLLGHPDQLDRLRRDPALIVSAVEEILRFDGPAKMEVRRVVEDLTLRGRRINAGDQLYFVLAAANRDPEEFEAPEMLKIGRNPNRHLGFGFGLHHCLGAPLARLEGTLAIGALVTRLPGLRIAEEAEATWHATLLSRGLERLPVLLDGGDAQ